MSFLGAMAVGARRALASPFILMWLWLLTVVVAAPGAWVVAAALEEGIGDSRVHEALRDGFDMEWFGRFAEETRGLPATFTPTHAGVGAFLDNLEAWFEARLFRMPPAALVAGGIFALLWLSMLGGVIDRFADRSTRAGPRRFLSAAGRHAFRFFRLTLISAGLYAAVYWLLFKTLKWVERTTEDVIVEGTIIFYSLIVYAAAALLITLIHASFGFAKVATVVENRRSMLLAAVRGVAFFFRHPWRAGGLYYGFAVVSGLLLGLYALVAPGIGQSTWKAVAVAFVWGQAFLLLKMYVRLSLLAGQVALYQAIGVAGKEPPPVVDPGPPASLPLSPVGRPAPAAGGATTGSEGPPPEPH